MKRLAFAVVLMVVVGQAFAQAPRNIDVPNFTPRGAAAAITENGWIHLGESDQASFWYSYWNGDPDNGVFVVVKMANKSIGSGYTTITSAMGQADCSGAKTGSYPAALVHATIDTVSAATGQPVLASGPTPLMDYPLTRGTAVANAVKAACDKVSG